MQFATRKATVVDAESAASLVRLSFERLTAEHWAPEARDVFLVETSPEGLRSAIETCAYSAVALDDLEMVGILLMRSPTVLSLLFVHPSGLRCGIGSLLWEQARSHLSTHFPEVRTVELNATPNSLAFYRKIGFVPISTEFQLKGCRATRMACWLPARSLGADVAP
jgi:GNAT superfamily N-acetyltransferase